MENKKKHSRKSIQFKKARGLYIRIDSRCKMKQIEIKRPFHKGPTTSFVEV